MAQLIDIKEDMMKWLTSHDKYTLDYENNILILPLSPIRKWRTIDEEREILMSDGYLGKWFIDRGFTVEVYVGDYEYTTRPYASGRHIVHTHKAYLRNRVILKVTA